MFKFKLFKSENTEVLYDSKSDDLKKKIVEQIIDLQIITRGSYSPKEFYSKQEWFFIRKDDKVVTAVGIEFFKEIKFKGSSKNIYLVSDFVNIKNSSKIGRTDSEELSDLFSKVVKYGRKDPQIDYLVCMIPKLNVRPLTRAGFNAKMFSKKDLVDSGLINSLRDQIIILNQNNLEKQLSKNKILSEMRSAENSCLHRFKDGKTPKSLLCEARVIRENRKFIENSKPEDAYFGLILGINTKK